MKWSGQGRPLWEGGVWAETWESVLGRGDKQWEALELRLCLAVQGTMGRWLCWNRMKWGRCVNRACLAGCKDFVFHSETRSSTKIVSQSGLMFHKFILVTLWRIYCGGVWVKAGSPQGDYCSNQCEWWWCLCQGGSRGVGGRSHIVGLFWR